MKTCYYKCMCSILIAILSVLFIQQSKAATIASLFQQKTFSRADTSRFQKPGKLKRGKIVKKDEDADENVDGIDDDIRARGQQEFLQQRDPKLNRVPVERLITARKMRDQFLKNVKARVKNAKPQNGVVKPSANSLAPSSPTPGESPAASPTTISGLQWQERGPNNVGGRTRALMFDIGDAANGYKRVFAGGVDGGLWVTSDITASPVQWTKINDFFDNIAISCIAQNPLNPLEIYAGTGEGFLNIDAVQGLGIWKTTDGGANWTQLLSTTGFTYVNALLVDKNGNVYAAGETDLAVGFGVDQSTDGGKTWNNVISSTECGADLQMAANGDVYASTGVIFSNGHIYISDYTVHGARTGNAGNWKNITPETTGVITPATTSWDRIKLATAPSDANIVYAFFEPDFNNPGNSTILSSVQQYNRSANTWTVKTVPAEAFANGQSWYSIAAAVDPNDPSVLYAGSLDAEKSSDGGLTWDQYTVQSDPPTALEYVHADHHAYVYAPGSSTRLMMGTDGGVFYSTNANVLAYFANKNNGYNVTQFYSVALHPTLLNYALAGAQDNGSQKLQGAGIGSSTTATGGDGGDVFIDQTNGNIQVTSYTYDQYYVSSNNGSNFKALKAYGQGQFINPTAYDPATESLYAGSASGYYYRAENILSPVYNEVAVSAFASANVTSVAVSPLTANRVYFGVDNGSVVRVDNAQTGTALTGVVIAPALGSGYSISCINVDGTNEDHILVTYSNYGVNQIMETKNASAATPTWTNVDGNLPDMPVRWSMFYPGDPTKVIIATELGVWTTDLLNGTSTVWDPTNTGLANVEVDMLTYRGADKTLAAATHGRGIFTSSLQPAISENGLLLAMGTVSGTASSSEVFTLSGVNLAGNITVTAPAGFDVSPDNVTWSGSAGNFTVTTTGTLTATPVYVRLDEGDAANTYSGSVAITGGGAAEVDAGIQASTVTTTISSLKAVSSNTTTNASTIQWTATFAASVSNLSTAYFSLNTTGVSGAAVTGVSGSGTTWTITVNTGSGTGTIQLVMNTPAGSTSFISNLPYNGGTYTIDKTAPTIAAIQATTPSNANPTNTTSVTYSVIFSEPVTGVDGSDFSLSLSGTSGVIGNVSNVNGTTYMVTVGSISGTGTLALNLNAGGDPITDAIGNTLTAGYLGDTYTIDNTPPTLSISTPTAAVANSSTFVDYTVTYNDANLGDLPGQPISFLQVYENLIRTGNVALGGIQVFNSDGNTERIEFHGITGDGTLAFKVPAGTATDEAGNAALASPASPTFIVDNTPPVVTIGSPSTTSTQGGPVTYDVSYSDANFNSSTLSTANVTFNSTGGTSASVAVTQNSTTDYTVTLSGITGNGTLGISIQPGTSSDLAGNTDIGAGPSATFNVINTDATLSSLTLSNGALSPGFTSATTGYTAAVGSGLASINITPTTNFSGATLKINGSTAPSGSATAVPLVVGLNNITIVVTAADGSTRQTYTIAITEAQSANNNLASVKTSAGLAQGLTVPSTLTESVANSVTSLTVIPTVTDPTATVMVNNKKVTSGSPSAAIALNVGSNTITIVVTAQDTKTKTYTITVTRAPSANDNLANLVVSSGTLSPAFGTATNYLDYVANGIPFSITPTTADPAATVTVNGATATSGAATPVPLTVGNNTVTIVVTAQNTTSTKTYTVVVNEARSPNNTLFSLTTSGGFSQGQTVPTTLTENVPNATTTIAVTPTMADNTATVTVNTVTVASGSPSGAIALSVGTNTITIIGTAQNGAALTYTLTVTRAASANLSSLTLSSGTLSPAFATGTTAYSASVGNGIASIMVTPTAAGTGAVIKVNGATVTSGSPSPSIPLAVGTNNIAIIVTAADNSTTLKYNVSVNRARSADDALFSFKTNAGLAKGKTVPNTLTESVVNAASTITIIPTVDDATATVTVNNVTVNSGSASGAIALMVGDNTITTVVTAQNGATETYTLTVTRAMASLNSVYQPISVGAQSFEPLLADDGIMVHQGLSPNGDGVNDFFQIDNINKYPDNNLKIMNRNGQLVFEAKGYDNSTKTFDGHSNKTGQMQLPGTYFYSLDYTVNGIVKHKTGFLVLKY